MVASADAAFRQSWTAALGQAATVQMVSDLPALEDALRASPPALLLLDLSLPRLRGAQGIAGIVRLSPSTRVVAITDDRNDPEAVAVLLAGAHGYCERNTAPPTIRKMAEAVRKGELWVRRSVMSLLLREVIPPRQSDREASSGADARLQPLTRREREIAYLVSAGAKNKDIAASLKITETTVKAHLTAIFRKLGIPDRLRLALMISEGDRLDQERTGRPKNRP